MKSTVLNVKAFFRSKAMFAFTAVSLIGIFGYIIKFIVNVYSLAGTEDDYDAYFWVLSDSQWLSYFNFIIIMFLSYEMFCISKRCNISEVLKTTPKGIKNTYLNQFAILEVLNAIITLLMMGIVIFMTFHFKVFTFELFSHILINFLLNYIIINTLAVTIGFLLAVYTGRILSYILMISIVFLTSSAAEEIASTVYSGLGIDIYGLTNLFNIFPPNHSSMPLFAFGLSVLPYRFEMVLFWLFLVLAVIAIKSKDYGKGIFAKRVLPVVLCLISVLNLAGYYMPQSNVIRDNQPSHANFSDTFYYEINANKNNKEKKANFDVVKYTMNFKIRSKLHGNVKMKLSRSDLNKYVFTLYHGYKVEKAFSANGEELQFVQESDKLTVYTKNETNEITIIYSGFSPRYYSNIQGIFLPAGFVYYPVSGSVPLYSSENRSSSYIPEKEFDFDVTVDCGKYVYCNLDSKDVNHFSSKSNALTLVSGFYKETVIGKTTFVFPYLDATNSKNNFEKLIINELGSNKNFLENKKVFIVPNLNQTSKCTIASDHIVANSTAWSVADDVKEFLGRNNK